MDISFIAMHRMVEERMAADKNFRKEIKKSGRITLSFARKMSDIEVLEKLRTFNVILDKKMFAELCDNFLSAEDMSNWLIEKKKLKFKKMESDWIWICLTILWERWTPQKPSFEMINDNMQEGYRKLEENNCIDACKIWIEVYKSIVNIMDSNHMKSLDDFDTKFRGTQSMSNWVQDLEMALGNACREDEKYFQERILFCEEFINRFPHADSNIIGNMKNAIAESYSKNGEFGKTESLYRDWLKDDPEWGWGWIRWSDSYWLFKKDNKNCIKAEEILRNGISIANVRDREYILERLEDLYREMGRKNDAKEIHRERVYSQNKFKDITANIDNKEIQQAKKIKVGRNDPCPCGSGKKYKKCCLKKQSSAPSFSWMEDDGLHFVTPGETPSAEQMEDMTLKYQEQIRNSPMWDEMVKEFGQKKAEELLKECRAKLK